MSEGFNDLVKSIVCDDAEMSNVCDDAEMSNVFGDFEMWKFFDAIAIFKFFEAEAFDGVKFPESSSDSTWLSSPRQMGLGIWNPIMLFRFT